MRIMQRLFFAAALMAGNTLFADNQTATLSPIQAEDALPFTISIEQSSFTLPAGLHSGAAANYKGKWVFIAGRTNGLHGFGANPFPTSQQNSVAYVVDWDKKVTYSRSLASASSSLTQEQIDQLSATSPQFFQNGKTLYISGGYGVDTASGAFKTMTALTAVDLPKFIKWVQNGSGSASGAIRQTSSPWMQVTGGIMGSPNPHLDGLLMFGQNFTGVYTPGSNGDYTRQARRFQIIDTGKELFVQERSSENPNPDYRRRDLNIVPIIKNNSEAFLALSGVFTLTTGIWTVPVVINADGSTAMEDPSAASTFKQGMNNYVSATASLFSRSSKDMYVLQFGGISFGYFSGGTFTTDSDIPFINQVTTVKMDKSGSFTQYLMNAEYPVILSTGSNPGNRLIFGAGAYFFNASGAPYFRNKVFNLDKIKRPTVLGYIVGGIMSTLANTNTQSDSTASPYVFRVVLTPR